MNTLGQKFVAFFIKKTVYETKKVIFGVKTSIFTLQDLFQDICKTGKERFSANIIL